MIRFLYENHRGSPALTVLNVLGVLNVLNVLHVLHMLNMLMDASLACWALFLTPKMGGFLYENHRGSPTLTLLNVLGVLGVPNVLNMLNVLNVLHVINVLNMPMDASLTCWALFNLYSVPFYYSLYRILIRP